MLKYIGILMASTFALGNKTFELTSPAFKNGEPLEKTYTCEGKNTPPTLTWSPGPEGTKSFALIMDDPDAPGGTWVHWVAFNIPATLTGFSKPLGRSEQLSDGTKQGINSSHKIGYDGPCPPPGKKHRYFFKLYALDTLLDLKSGSTKEQLEKAMKGRVLAQAELMGTFKR